MAELFKGQLIRFLTNSRLKWFVFLSCLLLPSLITVDAPHATRSLLFFYFVIIGVGVSIASCKVNFTHSLGNYPAQGVLSVLLGSIFLFSGASYFNHYQSVLTATNLYQGGLESVLSPDDDLTLIISSQRPYQYINLAWALKFDPDKFWETIIREDQDTAGIKGVSDLGNYHFFDDNLTPWPNWQIIRYNQINQQWEKQSL
jgi:hypothetical protein